MSFETIIYSLLAGTLPALLWLWFWLKEDNLYPEPRKTIILAFISGGLSVIVALVIEKFIADIFIDSTTRYVLWATTEELVKLFAVLIIAYGSMQLDEPIDAMIYLITVALGFAAFENTIFLLNSINEGDVIRSIITGNMRFIGATLVHVVSSASIGFMIGISFFKGKATKFISTCFGVILAITLHTAFNLSIINISATETLKVFAWVWVSIIILLILFEEIKIIKPKII